MHRTGGINMNLNNIISERLRDSKLEPSLRERYNIALKKEFSDDLPNCGLFIDNTFSGDDSIDYEKGIRLFLGKKWTDRKSTRLNSSHTVISYAVFCLKKKKNTHK